jgi:hypothetical protein
MNRQNHKEDDSRGDLLRLETGRWSLLHALLTPPPGAPLSLVKSYFVPYIITVLLFFGVPLFFVIIKPIEPTELIKVPFMDDWNLQFIFLVTMPLMVTLVLTERSIIPSCIASIQKEGVLFISDETGRELSQIWEQRYKIINILSQIFSVLIAMAVSFLLYCGYTHNKYVGWHAPQGVLNLPGWINLLYQTPAFCFVFFVYLVRGIATSVLLHSLVGQSELRIEPFHPDNSGGLRMIARIGLRNQYVLAAGGINILLAYLVLSKLNIPHIYSLLVVAAIVYVVVCPIVFVGPLLPFHKVMLTKKKEELRIVVDRLHKEYYLIMSNLNHKGITTQDDETITRLQNLKVLIEQTPVWPFDTRILRKFLTIYLLPLVIALLAKLFK